MLWRNGRGRDVSQTAIMDYFEERECVCICVIYEETGGRLC